jgi:repressor LexA
MPKSVPVPITPRQLEVLQAAAEFQARHCYSATIAELAQTLGASRPTVHEHLVALRENKLLCQAPGRARSLRLTERGQRLLAQVQPPEDLPDPGCSPDGLPLAGVVSAGYGIQALEDKQPFSLQDLFGNTDSLFVLRVKGHSMTGAGIRDGDYVVCHRQAAAENGQLVVAILEEEQATLKRFFKEPSQVCLMPANDAFEPIYSRQCRIEAIVLGLIRRM